AQRALARGARDRPLPEDPLADPGHPLGAVDNRERAVPADVRNQRVKRVGTEIQGRQSHIGSSVSPGQHTVFSKSATSYPQACDKRQAMPYLRSACAITSFQIGRCRSARLSEPPASLLTNAVPGLRT